MSSEFNRAATPEEDEAKYEHYSRGMYMVVVDPISRKLKIPVEYVCETLARFRQGAPSLCMLYLNGRCRQGPNCHQVHAEPTVVLSLRAQAQQSLMCCMVHGDRAMLETDFPSKYVLQFQGGSGSIIPIDRLALTQGLSRFIDEYEQSHGTPIPNAESVRLAPSVSLICRLHGQDRCRFSEECKFLHLCKELLWGEISVSGISPGPRRFSSNAPQSPMFQGDSMLQQSPPALGQSYNRYYPHAMSCDSLISMDLTSTPPLTPTSPLNSPVIKCKQAGDSWSYEPYGFNPIPMMPAALLETE
jgi:hypothetical protein